MRPPILPRPDLPLAFEAPRPIQMSMKRFLGRARRDSSGPSSDSAPENESTASSSDPRPIFGSPSESPALFTSDLDLNLNPSMASAPPSVMTGRSEKAGGSLFSGSKRTFSTKQSSYFSNKSKKENQQTSYRNVEYGQPLQILEVPEELTDTSPQVLVAEKLHNVFQDVSYLAHQYDNSLVNLTACVVNTIECLKAFVEFANSQDAADSWYFTTYNNAHLRRIMKIYLNLHDNLLKDEPYIKLKLLLVKNFHDFALALNSLNRTLVLGPHTISKPQNFAVGANFGEALPNEDVLSTILDKIAATETRMKEQNGLFIAPICRGISKDLNILCLYFGYPNPTDYHYKLSKTLHELYDDIHVMVVKNHVELAATTAQPLVHHQLGDPPVIAPISKFKLPFRTPTDILRPPMSLSLSIETSARTSGTMGGFIYPKIDLKKQPHLESYANSKFAISCGHVCLDKRDGKVEYPHVSAPLSVLISLYKNALTQQYQKFSQSEELALMEARVAYGSILKQLDEMFPMKKIKLFDAKMKQEKQETRNFPMHRFGQIIWGERTLIDAVWTRDGQKLNEKRLSDLAIIKVNKNLICDQNYLGDDVAFNEFDPSLMFDNLYVRKVIDLDRKPKELTIEAVNDVDSAVSTSLSNNINNGLPVFKYGSTTKFTKGSLNGIKLVYWLDGAIRSSEFVVNSSDNNSAFAAGGDSGSWILAKLEDVPGTPEAKGLGVVGMLHSYDGEFKQFGLFTPMCDILARLEEVTHIKWGVVGVSEKARYGSDTDDSDIDSFDGYSDISGYESSDNFYGAHPPEVD